MYDWARHDYYIRFHKLRYRAHVEAHGMMCQECGGSGGEHEHLLEDCSGPWGECPWCTGTGLVTKRVRGMWLRMKKEEKRRT